MVTRLSFVSLSCPPTRPVSETFFDKLVLIYLFLPTHLFCDFVFTCFVLEGFFSFCFVLFFYIRAHMSTPHLLAFIYER